MSFVLIGDIDARKLLADKLAWALKASTIDCTHVLEESYKLSSQALIAQYGETAFRDLEEQTAFKLLSSSSKEELITMSEGVLPSKRIQNALTAHTSVLLEVEPHDASNRLEGPQSALNSSLAPPSTALLSSYSPQKAVYEQLADVILPIGVTQKLNKVLPLLLALTEIPRKIKVLWADSSSGDYPILIGAGLLNDPETLKMLWPLNHSQGFCITDDTVQSLYGDRLKTLELAGALSIKPGESSKTIASASSIWERLLAQEITHHNHIIALGGGVVGDLAGFCAATYQRGMPFLQIPTTLVAQADAAYGGKTAVDIVNGKNYVGAYHQPSGVIVDPDVLKTLTSEELSAGWVEVLKTALIAGGELWTSAASGKAVDEQMIFDCIRTKVSIVSKDEKDQGQRQVLNLGHTIGHALESATSYQRYRHGEAVGLGLLAALSLSGQEELREQVKSLLLQRNLPVTISGISVTEIVEAISYDKKRGSGAVPFVLVKSPGKVEHGYHLPPREITSAIKALQR
jgi:shikimate kinase / 3-dehydroquinate synthase